MPSHTNNVIEISDSDDDFPVPSQRSAVRRNVAPAKSSRKIEVINLNSSGDEANTMSAKKAHPIASAPRRIMEQFGRQGGKDSVSSQLMTEPRKLRPDVEPARQYQPTPKSRDSSTSSLFERLASKSSTSASPGLVSRHPYGAPPTMRLNQGRRRSPSRVVHAKDSEEAGRHSSERSKVFASPLESPPIGSDNRERDIFNTVELPKSPRTKSKVDIGRLDYGESPNKRRVSKPVSRVHSRIAEDESAEAAESNSQANSAKIADQHQSLQLSESNLVAKIQSLSQPVRERSNIRKGSLGKSARRSASSSLSDLSTPTEQALVAEDVLPPDYRSSRNESPEQSANDKRMSMDPLPTEELNGQVHTMRHSNMSKLPIHNKNSAIASKSARDLHVGAQSESEHRSQSPVLNSLPKQSVNQISMQHDASPTALSKSPASFQVCLEQLDQVLKDEVALTAMFSLHDAKQLKEKYARSAFTDKFSPWKNIKPVETQRNMGPSTVKVETKIMSRAHGNIAKTKATMGKHLSASSIRDDVPMVPKYNAITSVKRNFLTPDDEVLRYIPHFGDEDPAASQAGHKRLVKELEASYSNHGLSRREAEVGAQIREHLPSWLPQVGLSTNILQRYFLDRKPNEVRLHRALSRLILKDLGGPLTNAEARQARDFSDSFRSVFEIDLLDIILSVSCCKELEKNLNKHDEIVPQHTFNTFASWMCLICGVPYCQVHGDYQYNYMYSAEKEAMKDDSHDTEFVYDYQPLGLSIPDLLKNGKSKERGRLSHQDESLPANDNQCQPCTDHCRVKMPGQKVYKDWTAEQISLLKEFAVFFLDEETRSCNIAAGIDMPCWQVALELKKIKKYSNHLTDDHTSQSPRKVHDKALWYNNEKKTLASNWINMTKAHQHEERVQLDTCAHEGPCNADSCSCYRNNILCERWCLCAGSCGRRFTGCSCSANGLACVQESCICVQMNRECGPECSSCGAVERLDPYNKYKENLHRTGCQNIAIQRGVSSHLVIGESTLDGVGFGAYLAEPVHKGGFIGEYIGEVTTFKESERRAIIYERKHSSFLFDLNSEWTLDAARHGNKTRFINHAPNEAKGLNCGVRVLLANGEHHIKIFALKDIPAGDELFFDYGIKFTENHLREKLSAESKKKSNGGALVGQEALDALDGIGEEDRKSRKKMAKIRSRKVGTSGKKMRSSKSATGKKRVEKVAVPEVADSDESDNAYGRDDEDVVMEDVVEEEQEDDEEVDDFEVEEDSDGDTDVTAVSGRPKRSIQKPSRYTR